MAEQEKRCGHYVDVLRLRQIIPLLEFEMNFWRANKRFEVSDRLRFILTTARASSISRVLDYGWERRLNPIHPPITIETCWQPKPEAERRGEEAEKQEAKCPVHGEGCWRCPAPCLTHNPRSYSVCQSCKKPKEVGCSLCNDTGYIHDSDVGNYVPPRNWRSVQDVFPCPNGCKAQEQGPFSHKEEPGEELMSLDEAKTLLREVRVFTNEIHSTKGYDNIIKALRTVIMLRELQIINGKA